MPQISDFNTVSLEVLEVLYSRNMILLLSRIVGYIIIDPLKLCKHIKFYMNKCVMDIDMIIRCIYLMIILERK